MTTCYAILLGITMGLQAQCITPRGRQQRKQMAKPIITVVGSSNTDLVVRVPHIPLPGETLFGEPIQHIPGGKGANQAVAACRLGAEVWFVGCLGDDGFGDATADALAHEEVRLDYLTRVSGVPSGVALIAVAANG